MALIYPEQWPGWQAHARQGGGLFDSPEHFASLVQQCWDHFVAHTGLAQHVLLSPPPTLRIVFRSDAFHAPGWRAHFQALRDTFCPSLNGISLPVTPQPAGDELADQLPEPRDFLFVWESPHATHYTCYLYLGPDVLNGLNLKALRTQGDQRQFDVDRSLLGRTKDSDLARSYRSTPHWDRLPPAMQRDLKYLGWTLRFAPAAGTFRVTVEAIEETGFLEGGDLLLREDQSFSVGEAVDFYQGLQDGRPEPALRCRFLIVPSDVQPTAPALTDVQLLLHRDASDREPPQLQITARVEGGPLHDDRLTLTLEPGDHTVTLQGGTVHDDGTQTFVGTTSAWRDEWLHHELRCLPEGTNRLGLSFPAHLSTPARLRSAVVLRYEGPTAIPQAQLQREWELRFATERDNHTPAFALNDLTLVLRGAPEQALRIPLAHLADDQLVFRYLPRFASQQVDLAAWRDHDTIAMWVEHHPPQPAADGPVLSLCHNTPEAPLQQLRLLNLDEHSRLLPSQTTMGLPANAELVVEGHRLQVLGPLTPTSTTLPGQRWDLLLWQSSPPRRITLVHRGLDWMQAIVPSGSSTQQPPQDIRSLWLSCGHSESRIDAPHRRNPAGGPCLAFGLGFGSQNEMAQIRPALDGFRLFRHRHNTAVACNGAALEVEPYENARGVLLSPEASYGWILVERALLRYRVDLVQEEWKLSLEQVGFLLERTSSPRPILQLLLGPTATLQPPPPQSQQIPQLRLSPEGRPTVLTLTLPQEPVTHALPSLSLQDTRAQTLPSPLRLGQPYTRHHLTVTFWPVHDPDTRQLSQHPSLPALPLLVSCTSMFGRQRYALVRRRGRLGYWYEGSQFIEQDVEPEPMLAPDYPRTTASGQEVPAHTLLVGSDLTQADLLLPPSLRWTHTLPFGIALDGDALTIHPLEGSCSLWSWKVTGTDALLQRETHTTDGPLRATLPQGERLLFRCDRVLFEVSTHPQDLQAMPQAEVALSLRGVFCSALDPIQIGGAPEQATLPLADPLPSHPQDQPLYQVFSPALSLCYRGEGIVGLRQDSQDDSLRQRLEHDLQATLHTFDSSTPMQLLPQLVATEDPQARLPEPALLHQQEGLHWPTGFLWANALLDLGPLRLRYHLRQRPDLTPPPERVPAWLTLETPHRFALPYAASPDGFAFPHHDDTLDVLHIGRMDPASPYAEPSNATAAEAYLSAVVEENDRRAAKLNLFGYLPRFAASLIREDNQIVLEVPAPHERSPYHLVVQDEPILEATRIPVTEPLCFHINHLVVCGLFPQDDALHVELLGYLLGHPTDPARPVVVGQRNHIGALHLRSVEHNGKMALQRAVCPPHFLLPDTHAEATGSASGASASASLSAAPSASDEDTALRTFGPITLPHHAEVALVDLQSDDSHHPALQRPLHCDRLLWFAPTATPAFVFPERRLSPPPTPAYPSDAPEPAASEGSTFFFDESEPESESVPEPSQGSTFFFDNPSSDALAAPPHPVLPAPPSGPEESEAEARTLTLGWFSPATLPTQAFGFVGDQVGPTVQLHVLPGRLRLEPEGTGLATLHGQPHLAIWRMGRWQPLHSPCDVYDEALVLCGPAAFALTFSPQTASVHIQRRWVWLPAHKDVSLCGTTPPDQTHAATHEVEQQPEDTASLEPPEQIHAATNVESASSPPQEVPSPPQEVPSPSQEVPSSSMSTLGWTELPPGEYARVMPAQRGHRVEVKRGLTLQDQPDGVQITTTDQADSSKETSAGVANANDADGTPAPLANEETSRP